MVIGKLTKIKSAPAAGQLLAYTRKQVICRPYSSIEEVKNDLEGEELLELHMFDDNCEYRAIMTESSRYPEGIIEHVADFAYTGSCAPDSSNKIYGDVYREDCQLEQGQGILTVLSHLHYDENGMILVDDYRLVAGGR